MRALFSIVALALALAAATPALAARNEIVADLSDHVISVTTGFTGSDLLLFGATEGQGDVVMVVEGPRTNLKLRRKEQRMGIWLNGSGVEFREVPSFYAVLSSKPLKDILSPQEAAAHGIGFDAICPRPVDESAVGGDVAAYQEALFRLKKEQGLYLEEASIRFQDRLFRANLHVPAIVPVGEFKATVFLIKNGKVVSAQPTPLVVSKVGMGAQVHYFANEHAALYGALAIAISVVAGWLAGIVFRKKV